MERRESSGLDRWRAAIGLVSLALAVAAMAFLTWNAQGQAGGPATPAVAAVPQPAVALQVGPTAVEEVVVMLPIVAGDWKPTETPTLRPTPGLTASVTSTVTPTVTVTPTGTPTVTPTVTVTPTETVTPTVTPTPTLEPDVYDCYGNPATIEWLTQTFGAVTWQMGPAGRAELAALRCQIGPAILIVHVEDADGQPMEGVIVIRWWPADPPLPLLPPELQGWYDRGVYGPTNGNGDIGFGMGPGDYYWPPEGGASCIWIGGDSDLLCGLGMVAATEHKHLNSDWTLPTPPPVAVSGYSPGADVRQVDVGGGRVVPVIEWPGE